MMEDIMSDLLLTTYNGQILGPIARILGWIMNGIYVGMYKLFGIENVGLSIFLFTILIYTCLLPLTYKQQKFSKLNQKMNPELMAIREKYAGRRDKDSLNAMNQETTAVYEKYGVSPSGSCLQMLIQMPILFAVIRVFYNVPAYLGMVRDQFSDVVSGVVADKGYLDKIGELISKYNINTQSGINVNTYADRIGSATGESLNNYLVDVLYRLPTDGWKDFVTSDFFSSLTGQVDKLTAHMQKFNYIFHVGSFRGLNISETPWYIIRTNFADKGSMFVLYMLIALLIPLFSYLTQLLSIKLMPTADAGNDQMAQQMKTMNMMMPLVSFGFCFITPVGVGIYWIFSALYRCGQQFLLNKHFEKIDLDDIVAKNQEKAKKRREKKGIAENQIRDAAQLKTRTIESKASINVSSDKEAALQEAAEIKKNARPDSLAARAAMVKEFNERNSRK